MAGSYYEVEVRPSAAGWSARLSSQIDPVTRQIAENLKRQLQNAVRDGLKGVPGGAGKQGFEQGRSFADAFTRQVTAKLEAAFRNLPKLKIDANSSAVDVEIAQIRRKLEAAARGLRLGIDTATVDAQVAGLQARLEALQATSTDVRVQTNTAGALADIEAFRAALAGQGKKAGDGFTDAFTREVRAKLKAASEALPDIKLDANSSKVDKAIAEIRAKLTAADNDIKLGVDARTVNLQLDELRLRLRSLSRDGDIKVRLNAGTALAELEALKRATSGGFGDDNRKGNIVTKLIADLRQASPLLDGVIGKLGAVGGAFSSIGGNNLVGVIAIVSAIVALISTIGPIVAAATGALVGLVGVAGVAGLAILGLKRQMEQQTGFGQIIGDQFKTISREASGLATVAANALGPGLRDVLDLVKQALPGFEGLINAVGGRLGGTLRVVGQTLITAFQKASPLILEVAGYIEDGAAALQRWVAGPGFDRFLAYARQQLPVVIGFVKDFGKALIDTFVALAPVGENVIKVLDFLFKLISKIAPALRALVDLLLPFVGVTDLLGGLFGSDNDNSKAQSSVDSLLKSYQDLATGAADVANQAGPLDRYKSVIGDLAPALQLAAGNAGQFQVAVEGITGRLDAATPAMATYLETAAQYVTNFAAGGIKAADTAKLIGDALTASRGNALDYAASIVDADVATQNIAKTIAQNSASIAKDGTLLGVSHLDAAGKFVDASNQYSAGSQAIVQGLQAQAKAATDAAASTYQNELATKGQATAANDALTIYKGLRQSLIDSSVAAGANRDEVTALADSYFQIPTDVDTFVKLLGQGDVNTAIIGLTQALNRLSDFIGAPKVELNTTDFDNGLAKVAAGVDYYGNAKTTPTADLDINPFNAQTANVSAALSDLSNQQANPRANLDAGAYTNQAASVRASLADLNAAHATPSVAINDLATGKLASIQNYLNGLRDKNITLTVTQQNVVNKNAAMAAVNEYGGVWQGGIRQYAYGGIHEGLQAKLAASVPSFAQGGLARLPQIAAPSSIARFAELSTEGEAFIPFAMDRRTRAEGILGEVAKRFGMAVVPNVAASMTAVPPASSGNSQMGAAIAGLRSDVQRVEAAVDQNTMAYAALAREQARTAGLANSNTRSGN